jgi:hypothetical protein
MIQSLVYSFKPGTGKVSVNDAGKLNKELSDLLGCKTRQYYNRRRNGIVNIPAQTKEAIEGVFAKYGVTPDEIWKVYEKRSH